MLAELRGVHAAVPLESGGRWVSFLPSAHVADRWGSHYSVAHDLRPHGDARSPIRRRSSPSSPRSGRPSSAASRACGRSSRRRSRPSGAAALPRRAAARPRPRPRRGALAGRRRRAHAGRGARVLRRARHADLRGVGHERDLVHRHDQPPGRDEFGSVGQPVDGMELWIADDGELLVRGPLVMAGYRDRPDLTARRSTPTAGCTPATSRGSTTTASSGSSTARRS